MFSVTMCADAQRTIPEPDEEKLMTLKTPTNKKRAEHLIDLFSIWGTSYLTWKRETWQWSILFNLLVNMSISQCKVKLEVWVCYSPSGLHSSWPLKRPKSHPAEWGSNVENNNWEEVKWEGLGKFPEEAPMAVFLWQRLATAMEHMPSSVWRGEGQV